eukprot:125403-Pyramimonas_sp.AAC.1
MVPITLPSTTAWASGPVIEPILAATRVQHCAALFTAWIGDPCASRKGTFSACIVAPTLADSSALALPKRCQGAMRPSTTAECGV